MISPAPSESGKAELRRDALARRDAIAAAVRAEAAERVALRPFPVPVPDGACVSGFFPLRSEINPVPLLRRLADAGATLALPVVVGRGHPLVFRAWSFGAPLGSGVWGIREPLPDAPEVLPDVLIVPLAAFDRTGHRIGYGAGYYDLTRHRRRARLRRAGDRERACDPARRQARSRANRARGHRLPRDLNAMRILFVGDVVGRSGRNIVNERLPALVRDWRLDCVIVNGENAAGGFGITEPIYHELIDAGADAITLGNHAWDQREALVFIERAERLVRPINYPAGTPGRGAALLEAKNGARVLVVNALGRIFMDPLDDPFAAIDKELAARPLMDGADAIVIDLHAEATSEKQAMGYFVDGRASVVIGTHTHAPTADHQILPRGTAFISDVGMTGDYYSVIGMNKQEPLQRFLRRIPSAKFEPALGAATLCGLAVETDDRTGLATRVGAVRLGGRLEEAKPAFWG